MKTFEGSFFNAKEYQENMEYVRPDQVWSKYEDFIERFNYLLEG